VRTHSKASINEAVNTQLSAFSVGWWSYPRALWLGREPVGHAALAGRWAQPRHDVPADA